MRFGKIGFEADGLLVAAERLLQPPQFLQHVADVIVGMGEIGLQFDGFLKTRQRLFPLLLPGMADAQAVVDLSVGFQLQGLFEVRRRLGQSSDGLAKHGEQQPAFDSRRILLQGLPIGGLGLSKIARLVRLLPTSQQLIG